MNYVKGKSGLTLPIQTGEMSKKREISVKVVEYWRRQLPLSDVSTTAKELFLMLQDSHQASLSYQERYEILALLRPTLRYVCQSLQKLYENYEALDEQLRPIADLVNALQIEMMNGYKLIIEEATKHFFYNQKIFISSIQNVMSYCIKLIFHSFEQHREVSPGIWFELHSLFIFAKRQHVATKSLKRYLAWHSRFRNLTDMYKHCLLFAIANPNHLRRSQIIQVLYAMENWAPLLSLAQIDNNKACLFAVDTQQDFPPQYVGIFTDPPSSCYFMNLNKINERILKLLALHTHQNQEKAAKAFSPAEIALPINYLESILNTWRSLRQRISPRTQTQGYLSICLGISACHWHLSQINPININEPLKSKEEAIIIDDLPLPETTNQPKQQLYSCDLINMSETGCSIKWMDPIPYQLQTGEIVGLEQDPLKKKWVIGVIRWLKSDDDLTTMMGVEILSAQAIAVKARVSEATSSHLVPTLLFAPHKQKPMRLVCPPLPFKTGNDIEIEYDNHTYYANLLKSFSSTQSYQEFGLQFPYEQIEFPESRRDMLSKMMPTPEAQKIQKNS